MYNSNSYKCFDPYYFVEVLFGSSVMNSTYEDIINKISFATKYNDWEGMQSASDDCFSMGLFEIGNHIQRISAGIRRSQLKRANIRKIR